MPEHPHASRDPSDVEPKTFHEHRHASGNRRARARYASEAGGLTMRSVRRGSAHIITLAGEFDLASAPHIEQALIAAEASDASQILLDLSGLDFIDSTGLRTIILAHARSRADGDRLRLRRGPPQVQRIFELTATADMMPFSDWTD